MFSRWALMLTIVVIISENTSLANTDPNITGPLCPFAMTLHRHICYRYFNTPVPHWQAIGQCKELSTDRNYVTILAEPRDLEENNVIRHIVTGDVNTDVWLGANDLDHDRTFKWLSQGDALTYTDLERAKPYTTNQDIDLCLEFSASLNGWNITECWRNKAYICQTNATRHVVCPDGFEQHGQACYRYGTDRKTKAEAGRACAGWGSFLAEPRDSRENDVIIGMIKKQNRKKSVWLGATRTNNQLVWERLGDKLSFTLWAPGQPNNLFHMQDCVKYLVSTTGASTPLGWDDAMCWERYHYICQKNEGDYWTPRHDKRYKVMPLTAASFEAARNVCAREWTRLPEPRDEGENSFLAKLAEGEPFYLGMNYLTDKWVWNSSGADVEWFKWEQEPSEATGQTCVVMANAPQWSARSCDGSGGVDSGAISVVCEAATGKSCRAEWSTGGEFCYRLMDAVKRFERAEITCKSVQAILAEPVNTEQDEYLEHMMELNKVRSIWIGGRAVKEGTNVRYKWLSTDISASVYGWMDGYPTGQGKCMVKRKGKGWANERCQYLGRFVCQQIKGYRGALARKGAGGAERLGPASLVELLIASLVTSLLTCVVSGVTSLHGL